MRRYTIKEIWVMSGVSERTLLKRAVARKVGKKTGKIWTFTQEDVKVLAAPKKRGNPALTTRRT